MKQGTLLRLALGAVGLVIAVGPCTYATNELTQYTSCGYPVYDSLDWLSLPSGDP